MSWENVSKEEEEYVSEVVGTDEDDGEDDSEDIGEDDGEDEAGSEELLTVLCAVDVNERGLEDDEPPSVLEDAVVPLVDANGVEEGIRDEIVSLLDEVTSEVVVAELVTDEEVTTPLDEAEVVGRLDVVVIELDNEDT